ncbi:hypothetical protein EVG20_g9233 [Dentipellis fragilis]|uniref:Thioesterase domain-containing protein n=1 Tax=Dentipellis fragilis TaxID=205917 RepID=A0A4Y9Y262_9AGAM|nr:hypothetical protein EVG20_g9233 [Dentipellis fragilis]
MGPFTEASQMRYSHTTGDVVVYIGNAHPEWTVNAVPQGGYVLGLIVEACVQHQASTKLPDPLHVTAHYLKPTAIGPLEVHVRMLKSGQTLCNITAELIQNGTTKVTTQSVFGNMDPAAAPPSEIAMTLEPPSPLARVTPFHTHPSTCTPAKSWSRLNFKHHMLHAQDPSIAERHERLTAAGIGEGGTEQGVWAGFADPSDKLSASALAFFADLGPNKLAAAVLRDKGRASAWFPTIVLSLEFRAPLPREGGRLSTRTVGAIMTSRFMDAPQGRHDIRVELWSAPASAEIGDGKEVKEGWREEQRCLLVAHQMALVMPMEVNLRNAQRAAVGPSSKL